MEMQIKNRSIMKRIIKKNKEYIHYLTIKIIIEKNKEK